MGGKSHYIAKFYDTLFLISMHEVGAIGEDKAIVELRRTLIGIDKLLTKSRAHSEQRNRIRSQGVERYC